MYTLPQEELLNEIIKTLRENAHATDEKVAEIFEGVKAIYMRLEDALEKAIKRILKESGYRRSTERKAFIANLDKSLPRSERCRAIFQFDHYNAPSGVEMHDFRNKFLIAMGLISPTHHFFGNTSLEKMATDFEETIGRAKKNPLICLENGRMSKEEYDNAVSILNEEFIKLKNKKYHTADVWCRYMDLKARFSEKKVGN